MKTNIRVNNMTHELSVDSLLTLLDALLLDYRKTIGRSLLDVTTRTSHQEA